LQEYQNGSCLFFPLRPLEHHGVWFEDLSDLTTNVDDPIHSKTRAIKIYFGGHPANEQNREVRTREERRVTIMTFRDVCRTSLPNPTATNR